MANLELDSYSSAFPEAFLNEDKPARCIDGRPAEGSLKGPQMLGGSLHPLLLWAVSNNLDLNEENAMAGLSALQDAGHPIGFHRGSHYNAEEGRSDCGALDHTPTIFKKALENKNLILSRLHQVYADNKDAVPFDEHTFNRIILEGSYTVLERYDPDRIQFHGDALIAAAEQHPGLSPTVEVVEGEHQEQEASVNLKPGVTLDTNKLNDQHNRQAFNLDLLEVAKQAEALGVDPNFAIGATLILYAATEMVLVEDKGKPAVPVTVHF